MARPKATTSRMDRCDRALDFARQLGVVMRLGRQVGQSVEAAHRLELRQLVNGSGLDGGIRVVQLQGSDRLFDGFLDVARLFDGQPVLQNRNVRFLARMAEFGHGGKARIRIGIGQGERVDYLLDRAAQAHVGIGCVEVAIGEAQFLAAGIL
jgi:hypothetical protein